MSAALEYIEDQPAWTLAVEQSAIALRGCELFEVLPDDALGRYFADLELINLGPTDQLFDQGDTAEGLYVVVSGCIKLCRRATDGRSSAAVLAGPGDYFGELSILDPGPRTADAVAVIDSTVAAVPTSLLNEITRDDPQLTTHLATCVVRRLKRTYSELDGLIFDDVRGRLAARIVSLAERFGEPDPDGGTVVRHNLVQAELAQLVATSRETVSKALADFAREGWIRVLPGEIVVLEPDKLRRRARSTALAA